MVGGKILEALIDSLISHVVYIAYHSMWLWRGYYIDSVVSLGGGYSGSVFWTGAVGWDIT
jgi:Co/Zn/Cd efflux system component